MTRTIRRLTLVLSTSALAALGLACGSSGNGGAPADGGGSDGAPLFQPNTGVDGSTDTTDANTAPGSDSPAPSSSDASDAGVVDSGPFVEALHPRFPLVVDNGGPVIAAPEITSVTFKSTYVNQVTDLDTFVATLGNQPFWAATTSEYGVGTPTVRTAAHLAEAAPTVIDDSAIQTWLAAKFVANDPAFGTPSANTLFVLFYPSTTTITQGGGGDAGPAGTSCQDFGGYHFFAQVTSGGTTVYVPYAVVPECTRTGSTAAANLAGVTSAASHEMVEAVTDPYVDGEQDRLPDAGPALPSTIETAYAGTSVGPTFDPYLAWPVAIGGSVGGLELGDMCESFGSSVFTPTGFPYEVQRTWSNKAVRAGHDPCAPYRTGETTFFAAVPVFDPNFATNEAMNPPVYLPTVTITDTTSAPPNNVYTTQGVKIAVGASATIPVILYADGPTPAWTVLAADLPLNQPATPNLTFAWDSTTGQNGDTLHLTITVVAADPTINGNAFRITSTDGVLKHTFYGYVGQN